MKRRTRRRSRGAGPSSLLFGERLDQCLVINSFYPIYLAPVLPFLVLEAAAASLAPLFSLEASLDGCFGGWGFGFFFGFLSLTRGLLPVCMR